MSTVLIQFSHGYQARALLDSGVVQGLVEDHDVDVVILSPEVEDPRFAESVERAGAVLRRSPFRSNLFEGVVANVRPFALEHGPQRAALDPKRDRYRGANPVRYAIARLLNRIGLSRRFGRRVWTSIESRLFPGAEFDDLLGQESPDLVLTASPGFDLRDAHLLRAARRAGVATAAFVLSWDNLTTRGEMGAVPDRLLVWNEIMREELRAVHSFAGDIHIVGAPHFAHYFSGGPDAAEARRRLASVQPAFRKEHRLVVWATINERFFPDQARWIQRYIDEVHGEREQDFLWIRVHPQSVVGEYATEREALEALSGPRLFVEFPPVISESLRWYLDSRDREHLQTLLRAADVVVSPQSTFVLDALSADSFVVNVGLSDPAMRCFDYQHYRPVLDTDAVPIARTLDELREATTGEGLIDRRWEQRAELLRRQFGDTPGRAVDRFVSTVAKLVSGGQEHESESAMESGRR